LGLGTPTRWTFSYFHQTGDDIPDYGLPWLFNGPAPVDRHNYYGFKNGNYLRTYDDIGTARVEHDVSSHFTLRSQARYANYVRHVLITEPQILGATSLALPLSVLTINRNELAADSTETYLDEQVDLTVRFQTGFIEHTLVAGVEGGRGTSDPVRPKYTQVPTTSLLNPDPNQPFFGIPTPSADVQTSAISAAAYALDTMRLGGHVEVSAGVRWDRFSADYNQSVPPALACHRVDELPTWRAAIVYKPIQIGSIYFSAGDSFNPSAESLALSASTADLPPEKNQTYEFGTKWDPGKLSFRGAAFRTEKINAREPDPNNPLLNVLAGNQRVNGVELEARGRLTSRWEILSGYAHLDSRVVSSNYYPASIGARLANVPANTFNLWTEYRLPHRWEVGAGGNFVASRTASSTAPFDPVTGLVKQLPGYWVFNAMVKRPINEHINLQLNVNNLTDRYYYDELHPAHIVVGPGRSVAVAIKFRF
jgi:catecholate siderophore receptor